MKYQPLQVLSCSERLRCKNSVENKGIRASKCGFCRLASGNEALATYYWRPVSAADGTHPALLREKYTASVDRLKANRQKRLDRDPGRRKTSRIAALAEKQTEASIIKSTRNSGRSNRDGDHLVSGRVTMDTKLQSTRLEPVVHLHELNKVRADAERAGSLLGCLTIRNKHGVGVVVLSETDFIKLLKDPS